MKKLLLTTLCITALSLNAQTEFTYTGTGNYTDQANWAPSYPGDGGLENPSYTLNIDGNCIKNNSDFIQAEIIISDVLDFAGNNAFWFDNIHLNGGSIANQISAAANDIQITGSGSNSQLSGTGAFLLDNSNFTISNLTINPGDTNTSGAISFQERYSVPFGLTFFNTQFVFDIFSVSDFDTLIDFETGGLFPSSNNTVIINVPNTATVNDNDTFALFTGTDISLFNSITFDTNPINGFQPQFNFVSNNIVLTFLDIEAPTITNCSGDQNVTADCGIYYEIPDYTATATVTENSASAVTLTQSLPAGVAVKDGTVITITATDAAGNSGDCTFTLNVTQQTLANPEAGDVVSRNISLFPNPSKGVFTLKNTSGLLLETGQVIDAKGALVKTVDLSSYSPNKTIDLGSLSAGIYLFKILTVDGFVTKKISIE